MQAQIKFDNDLCEKYYEEGKMSFFYEALKSDILDAQSKRQLGEYFAHCMRNSLHIWFNTKKPPMGEVYARG